MSTREDSGRLIDVGKIIDESELNRVSLSVIILCGLIMLMDGYDYGIISVAAPAIMKQWSISSTSFGTVFSAAFVGYLFGALLFGALSDLIGRKKTLILGAFVFSLGTLLVYFSNSVASLIPMRVFTGIGIGGAVPCALTLTSEYSSREGRGKYVSVMYSGFLVGNVLAGIIAGFLLKPNGFGWRPLFLIGFIAPVIAIVLLAIFLPESARWLAFRQENPKFHQKLAAITAKIRPDMHFADNAQFFAEGGVKQKQSYEKLFEGKLAWMTPLIWTYYLISSIAVFFFGSWSPKLLVSKGFADSTAAFITASSSILIAIGCLASGFIYDKFGFRRGSLLYVVAAIGVIFMGGLPLAGFVALLFVTGFFINTAHMDVTILAPIIYPSSCRNKGAGTAIAVARIGAIIGPSLGGLLLDTRLPMSVLLGLVAIPLSISAILCYIAGKEYDFYFAPLYSGAAKPKE